MTHFVSYVEKYEVKLKRDVAIMADILDKKIYLEYLISSRHSPLYLYSMYECIDIQYMKFCNLFEISSTSSGIASKIVGMCAVKEDIWHLLPEAILAKQNQS